MPCKIRIQSLLGTKHLIWLAHWTSTITLPLSHHQHWQNKAIMYYWRFILLTDSFHNYLNVVLCYNKYVQIPNTCLTVYGYCHTIFVNNVCPDISPIKNGHHFQYCDTSENVSDGGTSHGVSLTQTCTRTIHLFYSTHQNPCTNSMGANSVSISRWGSTP